jgi:hypothetical protein
MERARDVLLLFCMFAVKMKENFSTVGVIYRANHIRLISEFIFYATKNTNDADYLIPFIM